jgi:hypothetical protein
MKTKFMIIMAAMAFVFTSCGNNNGTNNAEQAQETSLAMEIDEVLASADSLANQEITMEGICTHTCKHGATKIFMMGSDDTKTIRVEAASLGSFDQKCINSIVRVKGILREERVDEAYLQRWEASVTASAAEQHGEGEAGCDTEKAARGETGNTVAERIADFRQKIAARKEATGKEYLSFYFVEALAYEIVE